ncbi:hypothetical protein SJPD1_1060 [Sulfurospirillum diekertiae]|uniref:Uncharacterized protein n=1 Tax=Sulfurospirillum diekertiae TaxID=1854492 RepID=A0A290HCB8_9BACT|nr:hypothetical protein [Sulfurospirillum diekertiae]ATB68871.1 hypothetical protein SJPD1_0757 [Sulfurospirillum diekertiae]ATB69172.1 hypothetical protein SJPD1_1060 [Sulfurospirillum diekertiae]
MNTKITTETVNGKEVPVLVHTPVNNGESANNVGLKDMSPKVGEGEMTMDKFHEMMALYNEQVNANKVTLSAQISQREVQNGKQRTDKTTGAPILDALGDPTFYPNRYKITLIFKGGTLVQNVSETMYNELELNSTYMFKGSLGFVKDFGQDVLSPIWQSWEKVS